MSDEAMTQAEILEVVESRKGLPIDFNRWQDAVAELHAALRRRSARAEIEELRKYYAVAGIVMWAYMTPAQRKIAQPKFAEVEKLMLRFSQ